MLTRIAFIGTALLLSVMAYTALADIAVGDCDNKCKLRYMHYMVDEDKCFSLSPYDSCLFCVGTSLCTASGASGGSCAPAIIYPRHLLHFYQSCQQLCDKGGMWYVEADSLYNGNQDPDWIDRYVCE